MGEFLQRLSDNLGVYKYVFIIGIIGGVLSVLQKKKLERCAGSKKCIFLGLVLDTTTALFVGYIGFEIAFYFLEKQGISVGLAGLSAWAGTDAIVAWEKKLIALLTNNKFGGRDGEF
ncbi:phage holin family protein [Campylobacter fetus]